MGVRIIVLHSGWVCTCIVYGNMQDACDKEGDYFENVRVFHGLLECGIDCGDNGDEYVHRLFVCVRVL